MTVWWHPHVQKLWIPRWESSQQKLGTSDININDASYQSGVGHQVFIVTNGSYWYLNVSTIKDHQSFWARSAIKSQENQLWQGFGHDKWGCIASCFFKDENKSKVQYGKNTSTNHTGTGHNPKIAGWATYSTWPVYNCLCHFHRRTHHIHLRSTIKAFPGFPCCFRVSSCVFQ